MTKFAMVFPGQGSQSIGMLKDLGEKYSLITEIFAQASNVLNYDLWQLTQNGSVADLNQTWRTQPALLTASYAIYKLWEQEYPQLKPSFMAGHSLGEYSALVCAGALDFTDAVKLVQFRGELMQKAVPAGTGAMYAIIGLDPQDVIDACTEASAKGIVAAVNFNAPGQIVIAGEKSAVEAAGENCKQRGAKRALPLSVSVPSHCLLMKPAAEELAKELTAIGFKAPTIPVINNVDVKYEQDADLIKLALIRQLYSPVRWIESIEYLAAEQVNRIFEIGPNKVLTGLIKRITPAIETSPINDIISFENVSLED